MSYTTERRWTLAGWLAAMAATLVLLPALSAGQESQASQTEKFSSVTDQYSFEVLLPLMPQAAADDSRYLASWCQVMARSFREHSGGTQKQIDFQRDAKKAEIKVLENRAKAAGAVQDEALKKDLEKMVEVQKLDSDILDSIKDMAEAEMAAAIDFEKAADSLDKLVDAYGDLSRNRGVASGIDYAMNEKALKSFGDAGSKLKDVGERLDRVAKARRDLNKAWQKRLEANGAK
jgi:hypothetical protein